MINLHLFDSWYESRIQIDSDIWSRHQNIVMSTRFQQFRLNSIIAVSCVCYQFHYSLRYTCSCSPKCWFKQKTCCCLSSDFCSSFLLHLSVEKILNVSCCSAMPHFFKPKGKVDFFCRNIHQFVGICELVESHVFIKCNNMYRNGECHLNNSRLTRCYTV